MLTQIQLKARSTGGSNPGSLSGAAPASSTRAVPASHHPPVSVTTIGRLSLLDSSSLRTPSAVPSAAYRVKGSA